jgi:hypothetical protein
MRLKGKVKSIEIIKEFKAAQFTQFKELRDSFIELKDILK